MTDREKEILNLIKLDPMISQNELADTLGIKRSSVAVHISNLIKKGYIKGKGYVLTDSSQDVIVIGGSNIDITGFSSDLLIDGDSNPGSISTSLGGVGRNIAENLARLNVNIKLLTALGDDNYGDRILMESKKVGIDMSLSAKYADVSTSVYLQVLDDDRDLKVAIADMKIVEKITPELLEKNITHLKNAKAIVADGNLRQDVIEMLCNQFGDKLFFDTVSIKKSEKIKKCFGRIRTIKPNKREVEALLGLELKTHEDIKTALIKFQEAGVKTPVISLGEEGSAYLSNGEVFIQNPFKCDVISVTGAGDAFMAGLVYSFVNGYELDEAVKHATGVSAITLASRSAVSEEMTENNLIMKVEEN